MSGLILHRRAALVGSCATAALGLSLVCGGYLEAGDKRALRPAGSLVMNNREVEISISENQLGLVATEEAERDALAGLAERFGLALENPYQDRLYLAFAPSSGAEELVQLARELRREGQARGLLKEAGLVAWTGEEPLVVTDELIVLFGEETSEEARQELLERYRLEVVRPDRFVKNQFLLTVTGDSPENALMVSQALERNESVSFAHPNFWVAYEEFQTIPTDPLFARQWHHRNTGASGGTVDADVDTSWAWDIAMGSSNVLISIQDGGTEIGHEDLLPNLFTNPGEVPGDNVDNDGNGFVDDVHGWDFINNDNDPNPSGAGDNHGTAVAGAAVARDSNGLGVVGSCPRCRVLPIRLCCTNSVQAYADAFAYSQRMGADIINNSWGHGSPSGVVPTVMANAINAAAAADSAVFFAAGNGNSSGWCNASFPSMPSVIAVSSATNRDVKVKEAAFGNCIDLMAPSHRGYSPPYTGTLDATTVDRTGTPGYNSASPPPLTCAQPEPADSNYTSCFGGTSFASPLTAGVAGLVRSAEPALDRSEVQHILQDTADKISPAAAGYRDETGFSNPAGGPATYAFGRVNAYEALKVAAPVADGGRGGVDIFLRDNRLDWGNTSGYDGEQGSNVTFEPTRSLIGHWQSVDIKVDAPPLQPTPPSTSAQFDALVHENPIEGANNRIYVRVHNRGPRNATSVHVKIHWAYAGAGLPGLPSDFWSVFPADSSNTSRSGSRRFRTSGTPAPRWRAGPTMPHRL